MLVRKFGSPEYTAVNVWTPSANVDTVMLALRYAQPNPYEAVDPATNLTSSIYNVGETMRYRTGVEATADSVFQVARADRTGCLAAELARSGHRYRAACHFAASQPVHRRICQGQGAIFRNRRRLP